jgi:dipeptidase E
VASSYLYGDPEAPARAFPDLTRDRLQNADVIYIEGGDEQHLARVFLERDDPVELFRKLLDEKVYVGMSAGSMIFSRRFDRRAEGMFSRPADRGYDDSPVVVSPPFGLFDWFIKPHLHGVYVPEQDEAWADRIAALADFPIYFLDDESAVLVNGERGREVIEVVGEGQWRHHEGRPL